MFKFKKKDKAVSAVAAAVNTDEKKADAAVSAEERAAEAPMTVHPDGKTPVLSIKGLHKAYGEKKVLKGLDLDVYEGELFGFIGKNGIGKSTTIDCVIGSKKYDAGTITINGFDVREQSLEAKRSFGYVASEPSCYEVMSGYDYLEFIANIYQLSEGDFVGNYKYLCSRLKLDERELANPASDYSHGMKQKLCLVASLLHNPKVWILDEPLTGLDPTSIYEVKECMKEHAANGNIVFFSSHIIDVVEKICDRIAIIKKGTLRACTSMKELEEKGIDLEQFYLDIINDGNDEHVLVEPESKEAANV